MYHIVCPAKYRRAVFTEDVDKILRETCLEIEKRYELVFLEIGVDSDPVHFLVQSVPMYSPKKIVQILKSITAREVFKIKIFPVLDSPSLPPINPVKSRGRQYGTCLLKRERKKVVKKCKERQKAA